jgi:aldose 1-epimerase
MPAVMTELVTLSHGPLTLTLSPACGGSVTRLIYYSSSGAEIPLLRVVEGEPRDPLLCASFPLVPFVNRIRGGRFSFRGREVTVPQNLDGEPSPLHGQGWKAEWRVARRTSDEAELIYRHAAGEWPWTYEARQRFALTEDGLACELACTNQSDAPMPCGLGHHPYFNCSEATVLDTGVACSWTIDDKVLPVAKVAAEGRYDLRRRRICGQGLDHGFGGWSGRALIDDPAQPFLLELASDEAGFLHIYSPPDGSIFAAEPVTHANAALNAPESDWPELGLRVLDPGETMSLTMRLTMLPRQD